MNPKLTPEQRSLALRMRAEDRTYREIGEELEKQGVHVSQQYLSALAASKTYQEEYQSYRTHYLKNILSVPIANKRTRLEKLQRLVDKLEKRIYSSERLNSSILSMMKRLLDTLNSAMTEVEGKPALMEFYQYHDYGDIKDEDLAEEREATIERVLKLKRRIDGIRGASQSGGQEAIPTDTSSK